MHCHKKHTAGDALMIACGITVAAIAMITAQYVGQNGDALAPFILRLSAVLVMVRVLIRD